MRALALAISLTLIGFSSFASDSERITQLEKEVQELKLRLTNLEPSQGSANSQQKPVKSGEGWAFLANWRSLKTGMSYDEVRTTLGEPPRIEGGETAFWYYPNRASVIFRSHQLHSWTEPRY